MSRVASETLPIGKGDGGAGAPAGDMYANKRCRRQHTYTR
jgi:hypothetical protein